VDVLDTIAYNRPSKDGHRTANKQLMDMIRVRFTSVDNRECQVRFVNNATQHPASNLCGIYSLFFVALNSITSTDRFAELKRQLQVQGITAANWYRVNLPQETLIRQWLANVLKSGKLELPPVSLSEGRYTPEQDVCCTLRASAEQLVEQPSRLHNARWLLRLPLASWQATLKEVVAPTLQGINNQWSDNDNSKSIEYLRQVGMLAVPDEHWVIEAFSGHYIHGLHKEHVRVQRSLSKRQQQPDPTSDEEDQLDLSRGDDSEITQSPEADTSKSMSNESDADQLGLEQPEHSSQAQTDLFDAKEKAPALSSQQHLSNLDNSKADEVRPGSSSGGADDLSGPGRSE
jgi:hypothetical protein